MTWRDDRQKPHHTVDNQAVRTDLFVRIPFFERSLDSLDDTFLKDDVFLLRPPVGDLWDPLLSEHLVQDPVVSLILREE